jgi:putative ABC transport system permease protein
MAQLLNFDIQSAAVPWWVVLAVLVVGLAVPLLAASLPVWRGSAVPVRVALATFGAETTTFGASALDRCITAATRVSRPLAFALRNGFRRRTRLALTAATLAFAGIAYMSAFNVRESMVRTLDQLFGTMRFDLTVALRGMQPLDVLERAARATAGVRAMEGWISTAGSLAGDGAQPAEESIGLHGGSHAGHEVMLGSESFASWECRPTPRSGSPYGTRAAGSGRTKSTPWS